VLDEFRRDNPTHELVKDATKQIANAFQQAGDLGGAAGEYERVANEATDPALRAEALLLAGKLHEDAKDMDRALAVYTRYVGEFPKPLGDALEAHQRMAEIHKARGNDARYRAELESVVQADARAGAERTSRTRTLAGRAALVLTEPQYTRFASIELKQPFEKSMAAKQKAMSEAIKAFNALVPYEVADVTAAATFYMAQVYAGFSRSLNQSERPAGLGGADLQDYNDQLDEMAFPFEEKAIGLHEKNIELMEAGVHSPWIEKSLASLAELVPARYARPVASSGFLGQADRYEYIQPATQVVQTAPAEGPSAVESAAPCHHCRQRRRRCQLAMNRTTDVPSATPHASARCCWSTSPPRPWRRARSPRACRRPAPASPSWSRPRSMARHAPTMPVRLACLPRSATPMASHCCSRLRRSSPS
jgi:hypothetical protein